MIDNFQTARRQELRRYGFGTETMKQLKVCTNCGEPAIASEKNCPMCGAKLPSETLFQAYQRRSRCCTCCGTVVPIGAEYCPRCGASLE